MNIYINGINIRSLIEKNALRQGWITANKMRELAKPMLKNQYGQYLMKVIQELGLK